jgi:hypothetical protein
MLNTTESLHKRIPPAVVKWLTITEQQRRFDTIPEALNFARQFDEQQRLTHRLRIEFAIGPAMFAEEIDCADIRHE